MKSKRLAFILIILPLSFVVGLISGCVTQIPVDEYTMARAAYEAAKEADSARFAPAIWFEAEQAYRAGQKSFKERHYEDARKSFARAQSLSEQAENAARLSRNQSGEVIP